MTQRDIKYYPKRKTDAKHPNARIPTQISSATKRLMKMTDQEIRDMLQKNGKRNENG